MCLFVGIVFVYSQEVLLGPNVGHEKRTLSQEDQLNLDLQYPISIPRPLEVWVFRTIFTTLGPLLSSEVFGTEV